MAVRVDYRQQVGLEVEFPWKVLHQTGTLGTRETNQSRSEVSRYLSGPWRPTCPRSSIFTICEYPLHRDLNLATIHSYLSKFVLIVRSWLCLFEFPGQARSAIMLHS